MDIFYLDHSPVLAAQYHCDKHVVKMILESVQIISTVASFYGIYSPYKPTHSKHPCVVWASYRWEHVQWLFFLVAELNKEYKYRFNSIDHRSYTILSEHHLMDDLVKVMPVNCNFTYPPQCMPEEYRQQDTVQAYRDYYSFEKSHLHKWTKREEPEWLVKV
jgi:hypothetical protein